MSYISKELCKICKESSINIITINYEDSLKIRDELDKKYSKSPGNPLMLSYQGLGGYESYCDSNAWGLVKDFAKVRPIIFFNSDADIGMFKFENGEEMHQVISNCFGFPFYVTDESYSYLICFDDHDCLICCGSAISWCKKIKK